MSSSPADFPDIPASLTDELLAELLSLAAEKQTTDLHFGDGRLFFRAQGKLMPADKWRNATADDSRVSPLFTTESLKTLLVKDKAQGQRRTVMYRQKVNQVRIQLLTTETGEKVIVRVQARRPAAISDVLAKSPGTIEFLTKRPEGLVLVTGPMGSGKSTFAAALAERWAGDYRHLVTLEDPVEYELAAEKGVVSHVACNFRDEGALAASIEDVLRSDMDALFIGEIRSFLALQTCFEFAGMREPVITTAHGGSIAHSLIRLLTVAEKRMPEAAVKRSLAQCLHAIVYVNLAYTQKGRPVPVVMCLPGDLPELKRHISDDDPSLFAQKLDTLMNDTGNHAALINYAQAIANAVAMGATRESAIAALPPAPRDPGKARTRDQP